MPPKKQLPLPIDRPLSRAYLREFSGWSTAFPPGLSDPTSLRLMENVQINRDGSCRVRPGLRYMSYGDLPSYDEDGELVTAGTPGGGMPVGTHETFFLNDGTKALLYAVREDDLTVGFRVLTNTGLGQVVHELDDAGIDFTFEPDYATLCFTSATTYVKFLQIDNKIFALSDAGEAMREFFVGEVKRAKVLQSIERPSWTVEDKLEVVHPDAAWITAATPLGVRYNLSKYGSFEGVRDYQGEGFYTSSRVQSTDQSQSGTHSLKVGSLPEKTNYHPRPLDDPDANGHAGWSEGTNTDSLSDDPIQGLIVLADNTDPAGTEFRLFGPSFDLAPNADFKMAVSLGFASAVSSFGMIVRYFNSSGAQIGGDRVFTAAGVGSGRKVYSAHSPTGTRTCRIIFWGVKSGGGAAWYSVSKVTVVDDIHASTFFDGGSGANYFWTGTANNSPSVYHPPQDAIYYEEVPVSIGDYNISAYTWADSVVRDVRVGKIGGVGSADTPNVLATWTRLDYGYSQTTAETVPFEVRIKDVPRGEYHYIDSFMVEPVLTVDTYFNGATAPTVGFIYAWTGTAHQSTSTETQYAAANTIPGPETPTADTLISSTVEDNDFSFGFFYTFSNEIGESASSQATVVTMRRAWSQWKWETPDGAGEPSGTYTPDPIMCADQLVAIMPEDVFDNAVSAGAVKWTLFGFTWSDQDPVPVEAVKIADRELSSASVYEESGWIQVTPSASYTGLEAAPLPSLSGRYNYSNPSHAGQGLVAADRMVLVKDPTANAVIRWSSNKQGNYTDFTARQGGGYKTLTSGNLMIPACVKLWQNPQSVDTLTILCVGVDGHSTGYYMAPATVQALSDVVEIMGFEETTATPGTVSPYGVEVLNNALFHPLDNELMKSTANNYNIAHKTTTEQIENMWRGLLTKQKIVSSQHDNRLYYIVNNPAGENLEAGCMGNEIWVYDLGKDTGTWSRWLIQAVSLRKVEQNGQVHMSVVRPDGIYYLDPEYALDDYVAQTEGEDTVSSADDVYGILSRPIPWLIETNTQGANRAHDAMANLQQANIVVGNFQGTLRYGVKGWDINGKPFDVSKVVHDDAAPGDLPYDLEDFLLVRKQAKEWFFYASSVDDQPSAGQLSLVQYRYTPISVNVGYEYGSVETFEYQRAAANTAGQLTTNGTPVPAIDVRRP